VLQGAYQSTQQADQEDYGDPQSGGNGSDFGSADDATPDQQDDGESQPSDEEMAKSFGLPVLTVDL
jgi:hypothetical protein